MLADLTFDTILISLMATIALREFLIILLPRSVAGPEGWLIRVRD